MSGNALHKSLDNISKRALKGLILPLLSNCSIISRINNDAIPMVKVDKNMNPKMTSRSSRISIDSILYDE
jgi:hypothetical protein